MEESLNIKNTRTLQAGKTWSLRSDRDLVKIRAYGRSLASEIGFNESDRTIISTALSEICRNVIEYAGEGEVTIERGDYDGCIIITVTDDGPGIKDLDQALQEGFSSGKGLGVGLPGAKRIMDKFEIQTDVGKGTTIKMYKWLNNHRNVF